MTTVIDPTGTPIPVYNKSGTTIQNITANGATQASGTVISTPSGWSVVLAFSDGADPTGNTAVVLPSTGDIGDVVEIYATGFAISVFPASGHSIGGHSADVAVHLNKIIDGSAAAGGRLFRRITATTWQVSYGNS